MENLNNLELYKIANKKASRDRMNALLKLKERAEAKTGKPAHTILQIFLALDLVEPKVK